MTLGRNWVNLNLAREQHTFRRDKYVKTSHLTTWKFDLIASIKVQTYWSKILKGATNLKMTWRFEFLTFHRIENSICWHLHLKTRTFELRIRCKTKLRHYFDRRELNGRSLRRGAAIDTLISWKRFQFINFEWDKRS